MGYNVVLQREDNNTINNRHWGKHASIQMFIKHSSDPREGPKPSLFFNQNDGPRKKKLWDPFPWKQGKDEQHPYFLKVWIHHWTI